MKNEIVINLLRIGAYLEREGDRISSNYNLNQQQFVVLNHILHNQPICQNKICSSLLYEKSNISKIIKKLKILEYIDVIRSNKDSRASIITCTSKGKFTIQEAMLEFKNFNNQFLNRLTTEEQNTALHITHIINNHIKSSI